VEFESTRIGGREIDKKPETVFEYRRGATVICDGEASFVERFLKPDDFILPFGGWLTLPTMSTARSTSVSGGDATVNDSDGCSGIAVRSLICCAALNREGECCVRIHTLPHTTRIV
jgi:hypothetical protein